MSKDIFCEVYWKKNKNTYKTIEKCTYKKEDFIKYFNNEINTLKFNEYVFKTFKNNYYHSIKKDPSFLHFKGGEDNFRGINENHGDYLIRYHKNGLLHNIYDYSYSMVLVDDSSPIPEQYIGECQYYLYGKIYEYDEYELLAQEIIKKKSLKKRKQICSDIYNNSLLPKVLCEVISEYVY